MKDNNVLNKPVGIWIRVSTEDQAKGESPEHHEERARSYAKSRDWQVKEVYDLAGQSGKAVMQHPDAKRMMKDVSAATSPAWFFPSVPQPAGTGGFFRFL